MRFLRDNELPDAERKRREAVREMIDALNDRIAQEWKHAEPGLVSLARAGHYRTENQYRAEIERRTERLRREIAYLLDQLPPHLELRADEIPPAGLLPRLFYRLGHLVGRLNG